MKVNVIQLRFNDVKLTKSIVRQLDWVMREDIVQIEAAGKVLGHINMGSRKLILIEANQTLYKLRWFDWKSQECGYTLLSGEYCVFFDSEASRDKYLEVYNRLKERAVEHIFI